MGRRLVLAVALLLAPSPGGSDPAVDSLIAEVRRARSGVRAVDARFEQEKEMVLFRETMRARGRLRILGTDRLRWDIDAPDRSTFVYDRGAVFFRGPDGRVEGFGGTGIFGSVLGDMAAFLAGDLSDLVARYRLRVLPGPAGSVTLVATPLHGALSRRVNEIRIDLARDRSRLRELSFSEPNGDRSTVRFTRYETNVSLGPEVFRP